MRTATVGYGVIGKLHTKIQQSRGTLVAVCDIDENALLSAPDVKKYTDYTEMLDSEELDIVHICTPHYLHCEMIVEALKRNINVLCEKPMCISHAEIERILEAEKRSDATLGICQQNRYNAANVFVKEYIKDKKTVSGVANVTWHRDEKYYRSGAWRGKKATEGGGVLINQALHTLDLMQWFLGMPESVAAQISNLSLKEVSEVEDTATLVCNGSSNFTFYATLASVCDFPVEISLKLDGESLNIRPNGIVINGEYKKIDKKTVANDRKECYGNSHEALIADFYDCVKNKKHFAIDGSEGAKVIKLILAAYESDASSQKVFVK